jgi:hypothetical protein
VIVVVNEPLAFVVLVVLSATLASPVDVLESPDEPESLDVGAVVIARLEPSA